MKILEQVEKYDKKNKYSANRSFIPTDKGIVIASLPYYAKKGECFVKWTYKDQGGEEYDSWKKISLKEARKLKKEPIKCFYCEANAIRLDHLHPYHDETTCCEKHMSACSLKKKMDWITLRDNCTHNVNKYCFCFRKGQGYNEKAICSIDDCPPWNSLQDA